MNHNHHNNSWLHLVSSLGLVQVLVVVKVSHHPTFAILIPQKHKNKERKVQSSTTGTVIVCNHTFLWVLSVVADLVALYSACLWCSASLEELMCYEPFNHKLRRGGLRATNMTLKTGYWVTTCFNSSKTIYFDLKSTWVLFKLDHFLSIAG